MALFPSRPDKPARRLARNNADWHRLIDLAGLTDTLIGDADGIDHPALFNDRLLLGLKGTMSEAAGRRLGLSWRARKSLGCM